LRPGLRGQFEVQPSVKPLLQSFVVYLVFYFANKLDIFWADQEVLYNYKANITGNRGIKL